MKDDIWYHGSPCMLDMLRAGSTITRNRELARVFSHKPPLVSVSDDGQLRHNGDMPGYLYAVAEAIEAGDIFAHPRSTLTAGEEWLTTRDLRLRLLCPTQPAASERLSEEECGELRSRARRDA